MPQNEPTPIDEALNTVTARLHTQMMRRPAGGSATCTSVDDVYAIAVILADTRRMLGRPVAVPDEDQNRTKPGLPPQAVSERIAQRRVDAGAPVGDDALLAENKSLSERLAAYDAEEKRRAEVTWFYVAEALGDRAPAEPLLWPEAYEAIRKLRAEVADLREQVRVADSDRVPLAMDLQIAREETESALDEARAANAQLTAIRQTLASLGIELREGDDIEDAVADLGEECARADDMIEHVETWVSAPRAAADQFDIALRAAYEDWCRPASKAGPSLAEQLHRERARWQRIQPVISALHGWEAVTVATQSSIKTPACARAEGTLLDAFEQWQKDEQAALNEEDGPVDVPRQPDDPGVEETPATAALPAPVCDGEPVLPVALELRGLTNRIKDDLRERAKASWAKYGTVLKTKNGRSALVDAYQESLDAIMYTTQDVMERGTQASAPCAVTTPAVNLAVFLAGELEARGL